MEEIPEEIFAIILPYIGGADFVRLRRTCWRLKNICDRAEVASKPVLWYRYVTRDFPYPMLESVAPWLNSKPKKDEISWKELYVQLSATRCLKYGAKYFDFRLKSERFHHFNNVHFKDDYLFVTEAHTRKIKFAKFKDPALLLECDSTPTDQPVTFIDSNSELLHREFENCRKEKDETLEKQMKQLCVSAVEQDAYNRKYGCKGLSTWMDLSITYHKLDPFGEDALNIRDSNGDIKMHLALDSPIQMIQQIVFNESQVVILFDVNKICVICVKLTEPSSNDVKILRTDAKKLEMLDNLLVVLLTDGSLESTNIVRHPRDGITLTDFRPLVLDELTTQPGLLAHHVTDFLFYGLTFVAISDKGNLHVSVLDSCDHESIERNCLQSYRLRIRNGARLNRLSATSSQGLKLAVLEQFYTGQYWSTTVHIVYIKKYKHKTSV